ncbi:SatD family protein [Clostridium paraputrificum]|uniref:SatD family protein n=1 Tax=Clostridium TaxID=1485 RepID=UPI003D331CD7
MYEVMICDIENSRELVNRDEVQLLLIDILKRCNEKYKDTIIAPFRITTGDEWEGLLKIDSPKLEIMNFFSDNLPDYINFYTGIGIGELSISDLTLPVNVLDGPAFHAARDAIKYGKKKNLNLVLFKK